MKKVLVLLFLITGLTVHVSAETASARNAEHRGVLESYTEPETKVEFPHELGALIKHEVVQNMNPMIGTVVRYSGENGECADIYFYAVSGDVPPVSVADAVQHFEQVKQAILKLPEKHGPVSKSEMLSESNYEYGLAIAGKKAVFKLMYDGSSPVWSVLAVFPFGRRYIKVRITGFGAYNMTAQKLCDQFLTGIAQIFEKASTTPERLP